MSPPPHPFPTRSCTTQAALLAQQPGHAHGINPTKVVFHDGAELSAAQEAELAHVSLPMLYNPHVNGLEDNPELPISVGVVIAQRYRVVAIIGKGSFSRVVQCLDLYDKRMVSVKLLKNDKDCLDQGLGEVRELARVSKLVARER